MKIFYKYIDHLKTVTFTSELDNYEKIKERFSLTAINYEANKGLLKNYIHKRLGDVAYVVETAIFKNGEETAFGRIPANLMEIWGVSTDEVFEVAISNLYLNNPPRIFKTPEELQRAKYADGAFMSMSANLKKYKTDTLVLSTVSKENGACALLYPGVQEKISEIFGGDYCAVFGCFNDNVRILKYHSDMIGTYKEIVEALKDVYPEAVLSEKIYLYDSKKKEFKVLD